MCDARALRGIYVLGYSIGEEERTAEEQADAEVGMEDQIYLDSKLFRSRGAQ